LHNIQCFNGISQQQQQQEPAAEQVQLSIGRISDAGQA